ncbi:MAG: hypothetical protein EA409_00210, partial [Saprospirales bacterium]
GGLAIQWTFKRENREAGGWAVRWTFKRENREAGGQSCGHSREGTAKRVGGYVTRTYGGTSTGSVLM